MGQAILPRCTLSPSGFSKNMTYDELKDKLKQVFNMAIFSRLLEMDDDEGREFSSSSLYIFIETGENTVADLEEAL